MARKHPRMGVLDLESGGRQGQHMGGVAWQMAVKGQVDGDVALVAQGDKQIVIRGGCSAPEPEL